MNTFFMYWNKIIEPHSLITDAEDRRQARFYSSMMLILLLATCVFVILAEFITVVLQGLPSPLASNLAAIGVLLIGFLISRGRYFRLAAAVFIIFFWLFIFGIIAIELEQDQSAISSVYYLIFSILIAGMIFSNRGLGLVTATAIITMFMFVLLAPNVDSDYAVGYAINSALIMLITAIFFAYRSRVDQAHQREIRQGEERWRNLVELNPLAIAVHIDTRLVYMNPAGLRLFGATNPGEILNTSLLDRIQPLYRQIMQERIKHAQQEKQVIQEEQRFIRLNGEPVDVEVTATPITYQGQSARQVVINDITERKQAEKRRLELELEQERANVLRQFTGASHDLRTSLSTLKTSLFLVNVTDDQKRARHLAILEGEMDKLEKLLENMLSMARLDMTAHLEFDLVDVNTLIRQAIAEQTRVAAKKQHAVDFIAQPDLPLVRANALDLKQVITNLLINALHYTPDSGSITIRTFLQQQHIAGEIQDNGIGISADDVPHIFERFFRADEARQSDKGGSGLGLAVVKKIVEIHGGTIEVESALDRGSLFRIILPAAKSG